MMTLPKVNFETKETILASIEEVAETLATKMVLAINDAYYRIVDFEFYAYAKDKFEDVHTHQHNIQLEINKLYLHRSGIDITFGDGSNYGGILLMSVIKLADPIQNSDSVVTKQINGPRKLATELFSNLYSLDKHKPNEIALLEINEALQKSFYIGEKLIKAKRIGLTAKEADKEDFYRNMRLRYIVLLPQKEFKQKIQDVENVVKEMVNVKELEF